MGSVNIGGTQIGTGGVYQNPDGNSSKDPIGGITRGISGVARGISDGLSGIVPAIGNATGTNNLQDKIGAPNLGGSLGPALKKISPFMPLISPVLTGGADALAPIGRVANGLLTQPGGGLGNLQGEIGLPNAELPQFPTLGGGGGPNLQTPTALSPDPTPSQANTSIQQSMAASEAAMQLYATQLTSAQGLLDHPTTTSRILIGH